MRLALAQLFLVATAAAAGLAFAPAFGGRLVTSDFAPAGLVLAVVLGAVVPALVVTAAALPGRSAVLAASLALVALLVVLGAAVRPGTAVFDGGYRLLTSALPVPDDPAGQATVGLLTGLAALIGAVLASYAGARAAAVVPAFVVLAAALSLDAGLREPPAWFAAVVLVPAAAALALLREPVRHSTTAARPALVTRLVRATLPLAGVAVILVVAAVLGASVGAHLPGVRRHAADARQLVAPPLRQRSAVEPLALYPAFARGVQPVSLSGSSTRRLDRLALVTLPTFTGRTWTTTARYRRAGRTLSDRAARTPVSVQVTARRSAALSWLLRPDRPTSVNRDGLGTDAASGDLAVPVGSTYPGSYRVEGEAARPGAATLTADTAVHDTAGLGAAGRAPASIRAFASSLTRVARGYPQLSTLSDQLHSSRFYLDDGRDPPSGNGYAQLTTLLDPSGKHVGTSEQYASAFAVIARLLGYDSRVVLGFRPEYSRSGDRFTVTGRDVYAWAQVRFTRSGWVDFDATPTQASDRDRDPVTPEGGGQGGSTPSSTAPTAVPTTPTPAAPSAQAARAQDSNVGTGIGVGVLALVLVLLLTPPVAKAGRRRRRRGSAAPAHAVHGAWRETRDRLTEVGAHAGPGASTGEVAAAAPARARGPVRALGDLLDRAGYAPEVTEPAQASAAWAHADSAAREVRAGLPWWRRALTVLDPRPLWRR